MKAKRGGGVFEERSLTFKAMHVLSFPMGFFYDSIELPCAVSKLRNVKMAITELFHSIFVLLWS